MLNPLFKMVNAKFNARTMICCKFKNKISIYQEQKIAFRCINVHVFFCYKLGQGHRVCPPVDHLGQGHLKVGQCQVTETGEERGI